jgi:hypothetical protein
MGALIQGFEIVQLELSDQGPECLDFSEGPELSRFRGEVGLVDFRFIVLMATLPSA